jgi:hypothetical protein
MEMLDEVFAMSKSARVLGCGFSGYRVLYLVFSVSYMAKSIPTPPIPIVFNLYKNDILK